MAQLKVTYTVVLTEDVEHTENQKVAEVTQLIKDQADAVRRTYDEGIELTGNIKITDTDETSL